MREANLPKPVFQKEGIFTVILHRPIGKSVKGSVKGSEKSSEKIIELMKINSQITIAELAKVLSVSTRAIEKQIAKLKKQEIIERTGSNKSGFWVIIKEK